ncbi:MAG: hypothetical protein JSS81_24470 [Acidobacteria bacterium]|nr:hypothetical protein [Acidobacteriota bacterium]
MYFSARACAFTNEKERALDDLERAFQVKPVISMPFVKSDPVFDSLRDEPRNRELLKKMRR